MSKIDKKTKGALVVRPGYEVGYGKPPKGTQFKAGQSGNPKGRPKGSKTKRPGLHEERLKDIILDEAYRTIPVKEGNRTVSIPMAQAVIRALSVNAAKGQHRRSGFLRSFWPRRKARGVCCTTNFLVARWTISWHGTKNCNAARRLA